jgi:hypothetical protein
MPFAAAVCHVQYIVWAATPLQSGCSTGATACARTVSKTLLNGGYSMKINVSVYIRVKYLK